MISLRRPSPAQLDRLLAAYDSRELSYPQVGASRHAEPPPGAFINQGSAELGHGREVFERARVALADWRMFPGGWLAVHRREVATQPGQLVATIARSMGLWTVNVCRVVYVEEERLPLASGGGEALAIGYGTLRGHLMRGEERFRVSWKHGSDVVAYDVWSFSWPDHPFAFAALPLIRRLQRRFALESPRAMQAAVE